MIRGVTVATMVATVIWLASGCGKVTTDTSPTDLAAATSLSCAGIVGCATSCGADGSCVGACPSKGTLAGKAKYDAMTACAKLQCKGDGGAGGCNGVADNSTPCLLCARQLLAAGSVCTVERTACLNDL